MRRVTDPEILKQLNGSSESMTNNNFKKVTDPSILAQLNNQQRYDNATENRKQLGNYLKEPVISLLSTGVDMHNALGRAGTYLSGNPNRNKYTVENDIRATLGGVPEEQRNLGHKAAAFAPEILSSLLAPEISIPAKVAQLGKYAPAIGRAGSSALTQAGVGALFNPETATESGGAAAAASAPFNILSELIKSGNPAIQKIARLATSLGAGYLTNSAVQAVTGNEQAGYGAAAVAGALASRPSIRSFARDLNKGRKNPELEQKLMQAGENLGIHVKPSEANPSYYMGKVSGNKGKTSGGSVRLAELQEGALKNEETAIQKLFENAYDINTESPKLKALYEDAYNKPFDAKKVEHFKENENVKAAINDIETEPAFKEEFKNLTTKDSLAYWDLVKRALDERVGNKTNISGKVSNTGRLTNKTKDALVQKLDEIVPEYEAARNLAQRKIVRENLEHVFNTKKLTMANMAGVLKNKNKFNKLVEGLKNAPEAQAQLKDMELLAAHMGGKTLNAKAGEKMSQQNTNMIRNSYEALEAEINERFNGKFDIAAVELMYNPKWRKELHKLTRPSNTEKLSAKAIDVFGKVLGQTAANDYPNAKSKIILQTTK